MWIVEHNNTGVHLELSEPSEAFIVLKSFFFTFCPPFCLLFTVGVLLFVYPFTFYIRYVLDSNPEPAYPDGFIVRDLRFVAA
jgi:hypothetical protein